MIPQRSQVCHNPPESHGDCFRACVASILELPIQEVPHFFHDGDDAEGEERLAAFLESHGLVLFGVSIDPEYQLLDFIAGRRDIYHLVYGKVKADSDVRHCVVGLNGDIVFDPSGFNEMEEIDGIGLLLSVNCVEKK